MQSISYTYDATGRKLRMQTSPTAVFNYQDGIEYNNGVLSQINTEERRAIKVASNAYNYEYTLTDHLGNNRVSFDTYGTNTTRKVGEESYYPFGLNVHRLVNASNKYLYNGKELQEEINMYDYGARFYDPVVPRFTTIDPLSEKHYDVSPYAYVLNNPLKFTDPLGLDTVPANKVDFAKFNTKSDVIALNEVKITASKTENGGTGENALSRFADGFMDNSESDHFSNSSLVGMGGTAVAVGEVINKAFKHMPSNTFSDLRDIVKTGKALGSLGYGVGAIGTLTKGFEAFADNKITLGESVSLGISAVSIFVPAVGLIDLGAEMVTGTSISDRISHGIDAAYPTANYDIKKK